MNRPVHFEIHAADPARVQQFYEEVFAWKFQKWNGPQEYWLITTGAEGQPGINGGMIRARDGNPLTVNSIQVSDVDEFTQKIVAAGGKIVVPKMAIQGVGYLAYGTDPSGNIFGVTHFDAHAT